MDKNRSVNQKPRIYVSLDPAVLADLQTIASNLGEPVSRVAASFIEKGVPAAMDSVKVFNDSVEDGDNEVVIASKLINNALSQLQVAIEHGAGGVGNKTRQVRDS